MSWSRGGQDVKKPFTFTSTGTFTGSLWRVELTSQKEKNLRA